ncbi:MAG TPA: hypothetical protein VFU47_05870, partial [Armatimonadota bacterium]|nr:hypothetical protein [Armatimonadota bacterium]
DDARVFGIDPAYPSLEAVIERLRRIDGDLQIGVMADVIWAARVPPVEFRWEAAEDGTVEIGGSA